MFVEAGLTSDLSRVPEEAAKLEALGYDGVASSETSHDSFLPLVLAAEHSTNLRLATSISIAFPRSPMITAYTSWDLQRFSKSRFSVGLGSQVKGHNQRRFSVPWSPPGPRLREYVLALKAIWNTWATGDKLDFRGEHYNFTLMTPAFSEQPIDHPNIPVLISAVGPIMCQVAGEVCDGLRIHSFTSPKYVSDVIMPNLEKGARKSGRSLKDFNLVGGGFAVMGDTDEEIQAAKREVARQISFYGSTRSYSRIFEIHGWPDLTGQLHELSLQGRWGEMAELISDDVLETYAVLGKPEDAAREIVKRYGDLCATISFRAIARKPGDYERVRRMVSAIKENPGGTAGRKPGHDIAGH